jgi:hypothetical protein
MVAFHTVSKGLSMKEETQIYVKLRGVDGWPPVDHEVVNAIDLGDHLFKLATLPSFAKRLAVGDIVRVAHYGDPQLPWIEEVVEWSGHSAVQVILFRAAGEAVVSALISSIAAMGGLIEHSNVDGMYLIDVPGEVDYRKIRDYLEDGATEGKWDYQEGAVSSFHE